MFEFKGETDNIVKFSCRSKNGILGLGLSIPCHLASWLRTRVGWGIAPRVVNIVMLTGYFLCKISKNIHDVSPTILTTYVANQS